jgi:acyl carrier protein
MTREAALRRLDELFVHHLGLEPDRSFPDEARLRDLQAADWRVVDLGIAVETEFGVSMTADAALSLPTLGAWRDLVAAAPR